MLCDDQLAYDRRPVEYRVGTTVSNEDLNALFATVRPGHSNHDFAAELPHCLACVYAYGDGQLVGFAKLAWDGGIHAFLLDPTVHPQWRRRGIGRRLVEQAVDVARQAGMKWVHVDYEPELRHFYERCGFRPTEAGLIDLAVDAAWPRDGGEFQVQRSTGAAPGAGPLGLVPRRE